MKQSIQNPKSKIQNPSLRIQLFQQLEVRTEKDEPLDLGSPTTRSLLAFLALNHGQSIDRRRLAFQFWPRSSEQAARRNLRQYLHRIRRALEPIDPDGHLLNAEGNDVSIRLPDDYFLDVAEFQTAVAPPHTNLPRAIELYQGNLLEDVYEDWVMPERERLAQLYREALLQLIDQKETAQQYAEAIHYARRYLAADPLLESAHVRLMQLYYAAGDRARVKQQYEQLTTILQQELGVEPMPDTIAMFADMVAGEYSNLSQFNPSAPNPGRPCPLKNPPLPSSAANESWRGCDSAIPACKPTAASASSAANPAWAKPGWSAKPWPTPATFTFFVVAAMNSSP